MKQLKQFGLVALSAIILVACGSADYKTTPSGLKYRIIEGKDRGKDSLKDGEWLKMNVKQTLSGHKDTVLGDTYGKMAAYVKLQSPAPGQPVYGPDEVFKQLRKGDSLITVLSVDSILSKGLATAEQLPPFMKKGDKITISFKVEDVFTNDSLAMADQTAAQKIEEKRQKAEMEQKSKDDEAALEKSGEKAKQIQEVKDYLTKKGITTAQQGPGGEFIKFDNPGTGAQVAEGKHVTVKYTGKKLLNDSTFESNQFDYQVGVQSFIKGFEDGLRQFKQGGKGSIYIPGYLAYGKEFKPPFMKEYEPLIFDVEVIAVSDSMPKPKAMPMAPGH